VARSEAQWLAAGRVGRPHGLDGSFHVTRPRGALLALGATVSVGGRETRIVRCAGTQDRPILRLAGHEGRQAAEALRGQEVLVHRGAPPPLDEDEWYAEDLEGCRVVDADRSVGHVRRLLVLPSCEVLEVERPSAADLLVPLIRDAVRSVDVDARVIDVDLRFLGEEAAAALDPAPSDRSASRSEPDAGPSGPEAARSDPEAARSSNPDAARSDPDAGPSGPEASAREASG
jgi:16S rRNA processing protein RimM